MDFHVEKGIIRETLQKKIDHPYLSKFIQIPDIDEDKLELLYFILKEAKIPFKTLKLYVVTTMLVQIALDTHERVTLSHTNDNEFTLKNRQLTVLAGDYYSGLYYYLLSQLEDLAMVKVLANAIKKINEKKISLYHQEYKSIDHFLKGIAQIESLLIQEVAEYVNMPHLKSLVGELMLLNRLIKEKNIFIRKGHSNLLEYINDFNGLTDTEEIFDLYIKSTKDRIGKLSATSMSTFLKERIDNIIYEFNINLEKVEEG